MPRNEYLSTYHLSTGTHRAYQPAKGNFFEFIVEDTSDWLKPGVDPEGLINEETDYVKTPQEIIRLTVNKTSVPHFDLEELSIRKGNSVVYYAGVPTFPEGTVEIDDMIGIESKATLEAWQNQAYNVMTDKGGRAINYKHDATLIEYTADHIKVRSWKLIGCWVKSLSEEDYDKETDNVRRVSATIRYDRAIPEIAE